MSASPPLEGTAASLLQQCAGDRLEAERWPVVALQRAAHAGGPAGSSGIQTRRAMTAGLRLRGRTNPAAAVAAGADQRVCLVISSGGEVVTGRRPPGGTPTELSRISCSAPGYRRGGHRCSAGTSWRANQITEFAEVLASAGCRASDSEAACDHYRRRIPFNHRPAAWLNNNGEQWLHRSELLRPDERRRLHLPAAGNRRTLAQRRTSRARPPYHPAFFTALSSRHVRRRLRHFRARHRTPHAPAEAQRKAENQQFGIATVQACGPCQS